MVLSSLLPKDVEAVGISTGGTQSRLAEGKHRKLCIHAGLGGLICVAETVASSFAKVQFKREIQADLLPHLRLGSVLNETEV